MINFAAQDTMQPKDLHKRKTSLPEISGVNQRSLSLLIDQPGILSTSMTPLARRGGFTSRNMSIGLPNTTSNAGLISPGYAGIVQSARREVSNLRPAMSGTLDVSGDQSL